MGVDVPRFGLSPLPTCFLSIKINSIFKTVKPAVSVVTFNNLVPYFICLGDKKRERSNLFLPKTKNKTGKL